MDPARDISAKAESIIELFLSIQSVGVSIPIDSRGNISSETGRNSGASLSERANENTAPVFVGIA